MSIRVWFYQRMAGDTELETLVGDRIFQGESMRQAPETKPFIIYRFGNTSPDNDVRIARRQYATVYIHDQADPGEYMLIDDIERRLKLLFEDAYDRANNIVNVRWLETSADFDDREMGTILRYVRFQIITANWYT